MLQVLSDAISIVYGNINIYIEKTHMVYKHKKLRLQVDIIDFGGDSAKCYIPINEKS